MTLLNADYKLIAKALANKIKPFLETLIHGDQTGFMKGRYIGENVVRIMDIMQYTDENDIPAILMQIDFEKAFDSVEWAFIDRVLETFNFGTVLRNWVKILYSDISTCVINNGWSSKYFSVSRGMRQGCPISPYLFTLCVELLALSIRNNDNIKGIQIGDTEFKISQYADDTSLTLLYSHQNLVEVISTFDRFHSLSGLKVNYDKTEIMRIGSLKNSVAKLITAKPFKWTNDPVNVLGATLTTVENDLCELNFPQQQKKIENLIKIWNQRILTFYGKITLINSHLVSQLVYKLSMLPSPSTAFTSVIQDTLFQFLWHGRRPKIRKDVLYGDYDVGVIRMVNLINKCKSLKAAWVPRILKSISNGGTVHIYLESLVHPLDLSIIFFQQFQNG